MKNRKQYYYDMIDELFEGAGRELPTTSTKDFWYMYVPGVLFDVIREYMDQNPSPLRHTKHKPRKRGLDNKPPRK